MDMSLSRLQELAWHAAVHGVPKSWTWLSNWTEYDCSVTQSYPTLCSTMGCSPLASSICGILQVRIPEWVAILLKGFSRPRIQSGSLVSSALAAKLPLYHLGFSELLYLSPNISHTRGRAFPFSSQKLLCFRVISVMKCWQFPNTLVYMIVWYVYVCVCVYHTYIVVLYCSYCSIVTDCPQIASSFLGFPLAY